VTGPFRAQVAATARSLAEAGPEPTCAYVYDLAGIRARAEHMAATLPHGCRLYYAMKANSGRPILAALAPRVAGFEAASLGEVTRARSVAPTAPVVFGGPGKTDGELAGALRRGVELVHVESPHELRRLERIAAAAGTTAPVLLRVNLAGPLPVATLAMAGRPTPFGVDEAEAPAVATYAHASPHLRLDGFHFHSVSNHLDADRHAQLVGHYLRRAARWAAEVGFRLRVVNAGGGFGVNYADLAEQFAWDRFVAGLRRVVVRDLPPGCTLAFEPGRYMVAAHGAYLAEVLDVKANHGEAFVVVRGGTHHFRLPASWQHSHPFSVVAVDAWHGPPPRPEAAGRPVTVVGQLCSPKDVLARGVRVTRVRAGDVIVFPYAGAYGWSISHHDFLSHPHPRHLYLG
jgi:diaminopimelate decarboxylase